MDFADGGRATGAQVTHLFASAGSYTVTLLVADGRGGVATSAQAITVSAGATPSATATVAVRVRDHGIALSGATVRVLQSGATVVTDAQGLASIAVGVGARQTLRVEAAGYARQTRVLDLAAGTTTGFLEVGMRVAGSLQVLPAIENGGTLASPEGAKVVLAPGSLVTTMGGAVTGAVEARLTPVDVVADTPSFPGKFEGYDSGGQSGLLLSWGTADFTFTQNGNALNLAPGARATVELPLYSLVDTDGSVLAEGDVFPLWALDESNGVWIQEGTGTVVASAAAPLGYVLRAEVGHFSWWNHDRFADGYQGEGGCCIDSNFDGACDGPTMCYVRGRTNCAGSICGSRDAASPPAWMADDIIASGATKSLLLPALYPVELEGATDNGTTTGRVVISGTKDTTVPFMLVLQPAMPAPTGPTGLLITLPHDHNYASGPSGSVATFEFNAVQNDVVLVSVERTAGSLLQGQVRLYAPASASVPVDTASFGATAATIIRSVTNGKYTLQIDGDLNEPGGFRLVVKAIGSAPYVVSVSPAPAATLVPSSEQIVARFSSSLKASTVNASTFIVSTPAGALTGVYGVTGPTASFTPSSPLPAGTPVTVQLTTGVQNTLNAGLPQPYSWTFVPAEALDTRMVVSSNGVTTAKLLPTGQIAVLFMTSAPTYSIRLAIYTPGVGVTSVETIDTGMYTFNSQPLSIAGNALGDLIAVWVRQYTMPSSSFELVARRFTAGVGWSDVDVLVSGSAFVQYAMGGIDDLGRALVVYHDAAPSTPHGWSRRYVPGLGWEAAQQFDSPVGLQNDISAFAMNGAGDAVVGWRNTYNGYANTFDEGTGAWDAGVNLGNAQGNVRDAQMDASSASYVLWSDGLDKVFVARKPSGQAWEPTHTVPSGSSLNCAPALGVSAASGVVAVAACSRPGNYIPFIEHWPGGTWGPSGSTWEPVAFINGPSGAAGGVQLRLGAWSDGGADLLWDQGGPGVSWSTYAPEWTGVPAATGTITAVSNISSNDEVHANATCGAMVGNTSGVFVLRYR